MPRGRPRKAMPEDGQVTLPGVPAALTVEDLAIGRLDDMPIVYVPIKRLQAYNLGAAPDAALVESVKQVGILNPVSIIDTGYDKQGPTFTVWDGRRRVQAAVRAGLDQVPARLYPPDDRRIQLLTLVMNSHRRPNPWAEWLAIKALMDAGADMAAIAQATRLPIATIKRRAKLGNLIPLLARYVADGLLSAAVAEAVAALSEEYQKRLLYTLGQNGKLTMADVRGVVKVRATEATESYLPLEMFTEQGTVGADMGARFQRVYDALAGLVGPEKADEIASGELVGPEGQTFYLPTPTEDDHEDPEG